MGLGIVNDAEFEKELGRSVSIPVPAVVVDKNVGRGKDDLEVPNSLRKIIGEEAIINGRKAARELAKSFGISDSSINAYTNGSTSTKTYNKQPNLAHLNSARMRVAGHARAKLTKALNHIDSEKLAACGAVELATVAKSMSGIIKDMEPEAPKMGGDGEKNGPTFIFYAPNVKEEKHYDVINARE